MIRNFYIGLKEGMLLWRICLIVYGIQLLFGIPFGLQVYHVLEASLGQSIELEKLLLAYDHTVYRDLLSTHGASISPIIGQLRWVILVYLIIGIFIHAGVLFCADRKKYQWNAFWQGASRYFSAFLKIGLVFLLIWVLWTGIIWVPILRFSRTALEYLPTERAFILICLAALLIYIIGLMYLFNASLASRFDYLKSNQSWFRSIRRGMIWAYRHYGNSTLLLIVFLCSLIILIVVYLALENSPGMISALLVVLYFILQQLFVFFRIFWRVSTYSGLLSLYRQTNP